VSTTSAPDPMLALRPRVLVVTADAGRAAVLAQAVSQATEGAAGIVVRATAAAALEAVSAGVDLCLFDLSDPARLDLDACLAILRTAGVPRVVVVASEEQTPLAAQAVCAGAYEFRALDVDSRLELQRSLQQALRKELPPEADDGSVPPGVNRVLHDLNNSLGGIVGLADLLARDPDLSPATRERLAEVRRSAKRGAELVATLRMSSPPRRESEAGAGTSFEILLQRANETTGPDSTPDPEGTALKRERAVKMSPGAAPRGTVLLVEDDEVLRSTYQELLAGQGLLVLVAGDGFNALLQASTHPGRIDLLVSDVILPQMSGIELWRKLSRYRPEAQVLFISGNVNQARIMIGQGQGPHHLLAKPFGATSLLETVRMLLASSPLVRPEGPALA
jgi:CheY-like chemotaxis protein